ncbi:MAG TPA: long-chain fatty acid--CoA ligase [Desulfotomaculum sp.]|nr:MAG: hypothetical protein JL56_06375 [Desulfotomaculum sp. BICA1-6]HBX24620.1 long-chain fatty acid--CoA ligase [Desulfotomaculum sp.]
MYTVGDLIEISAAKYPARPALVYPPKGQRWNFRQWNDQVNRVANALLKLGIGRGDRVSTYLGNSSELVTVLFAAAKIGAVYNPINNNLSPVELAFILNDAESRVLVFGAGESGRVTRARGKIKTVEHYLYIDEQKPGFAHCYYQLLTNQPSDKPDISVSENDWFSVMYTSGTTGRPKGVIHRHRDIVDHSMCMIHAHKMTYQDRGLSVDPLYHAAELHAIFIPRVHAGAAGVILQDPDPQALLQMLKEEEITIMFMDPVLCGLVMQDVPKQFPLPRFRLLVNGGAPMSTELAAQCRAVLQTNIIHMYGMTEMGPVISALYPEEMDAKHGSVGKPLINHEIRVVRMNPVYPSDPNEGIEAGAIGEIIVRGVGMMQGYYNRPEVTTEAMYGGWFHTGDTGRFDEDGYLWLTGRRDDVIFAGIENVYPGEIEAILLEHPDILDAAVIGVESGEWENQIVAFIVTNNVTLTSLEVDQYLRDSEKLAGFKIPGAYRFVQKLPRVTTGKVQKRLLIEQLIKGEVR